MSLTSTAYWISKAEELSKESKCLRRDVGVVLIDEDEIFYITGVNGTALCQKDGCLRAFSPTGRDIHRCRGSHSEVRAIFTLAKLNPETNRKFTLYSTHLPCPHCAPVIVESGWVREVVYKYSYGEEELSMKILTEGKVKVRRWNK